jgi:hypothetical protein
MVMQYMTIQCNEYVRYALTTLSYQCRSCYQYFTSSCVLIEKMKMSTYILQLTQVTQWGFTIYLKGP